MLTIIKSRGISEFDATAAPTLAPLKSLEKGKQQSEEAPEQEDDFIAQLGAKFGCSFERNPILE